MITKGIARNEDSDSEDEPEETEGGLTQEQVDTLQYVAITLGRDKALRQMEKLVLKEQAGGHGMMMFNTMFSFTLLQTFNEFSKWHTKLTWPERFDSLFAFTHMLDDFDVWMHDHEACWADDGGKKMITDLAKLWKAVLKKDDKTLKVDGEFTRPGVVALLGEFKSKVEGLKDEDVKLQFNFM
jgi:hypothetical protein